MDPEPADAEFQEPEAEDELVFLLGCREKFVRYIDFPLTPQELRNVGSALACSKFVQSLYLVNNDIGSDGGEVLGEAMKLNDTLVTLRVDDNKLEDESIRSLLQGLRVNRTLAALSLAGNGLGCQSVVALAKYLKTNNSLFVLTLSNNHIADTGVVALATALEDNATLRTLRLDNNYIAANGVQCLATSLEVNTGLRDLSLWSNRFLERSAEGFIDTLTVNTTLQSLVCSLSSKSRLQSRIDDKLHAAFGRSKLMVMGKECVGKSATVNSLLGKEFNPEWDSTVGIELNDVIASSWNSWEKHTHGENIRLVVKRAAVESVVKMNAEATKKQRRSPKRMEAWSKIDGQGFSWKFQLQQQRPTANDQPPSLHMNRPKPKPILSSSKSFSAIREKKAEIVPVMTVKDQVRYDDDAFRRSGEWSDKVSLSVWDCGGQDVFFNLHQLFMTKYCIYLVVFDASALFRDFEKEFPTLMFWLKYISLYAPGTPTLLVGTHAAALPSESKTKNLNNEIRRRMGTNFPQVMEFDQFAFHPLDNKTGLGVTQLRKKIDTLASAQPYTKIQVSVRWMWLLEMMLQSGNGWLPFKQVRQLASDLGIKSLQEVTDMLCLFHELGACIFFTSSPKLQSIVTTNPQWLIDSLTKVIKDSERHHLNTVELEQIGLSEDVDTLYSTGLASIDLLNYLWGGERLGFLTDLLRSLLLASPWTLQPGEEVYLFPALVRRTTPRINPSGEKCTMSFSYLPQGLFERLVCMMIEFSFDQECRKEPVMLQGMAKVYLARKAALYLEKKQNDINVYIPKKHCYRYLQVILTLMRSLKEKYLTACFSWDMRLEQKGSMVPIDQVKESTSSGWFLNKKKNYDDAIENFLETI